MSSNWTEEDILFLIKFYKVMTIKEFKRAFPHRSEDSINSKIKRLKSEGRIKGEKTQSTVTRSLRQRGSGKNK